VAGQFGGILCPRVTRAEFKNIRGQTNSKKTRGQTKMGKMGQTKMGAKEFLQFIKFFRNSGHLFFGFYLAPSYPKKTCYFLITRTPSLGGIKNLTSTVINAMRYFLDTYFFVY
jgi:hypothetical protein